MNPIPPIFIDPLLQQRFDTEGYVKIRLLEPADIEKLRESFHTFYPHPSGDFYSSSYDNNYKLKKEMSDEIGKIIVPRLTNIFRDFTWFGSAFLSKGNGNRSEMPMHQDWTIVDEKKYVAINIWTPLQDTHEENGTLEVIPGSHRWHESLRAPTLPFHYDGYQSQLKPSLVPIPAVAGEAVVLNQSLIHYSKPNRTDKMRIAITTGIKTAGAPMLFHYWNTKDPGMIEMFEQEDDFLIRFENFHQSIFERPVIGKSIGTRPYQVPKVSKEEVDKITGSHSSSKPTGNWMKKLFGWGRE